LNEIKADSESKHSTSLDVISANIQAQFENIYEGLSVLVTGHTGFKGSWLTIWLVEMGAYVVGFSLAEPPTVPSNFELSDLGGRMTDVRGDVRDLEQLRETVEIHQP
jgi:CDP-glucose 4,6-dehydratase